MTVMKRWEQSRQGKAHDVTVTQARPTGSAARAELQESESPGVVRNSTDSSLLHRLVVVDAFTGKSGWGLTSLLRIPIRCDL